jgi:DNA-binding NtrC family response regulator
MYMLTLRNGVRKGMSWRVTEAPLVMGRGNMCDIHVADPVVSRRHCEVSLENGSVVLRDLGSANATLVNGTPAREMTLSVGDELALGESCFVLTEVPDVPQPEPAATGAIESTISLGDATFLEDEPGDRIEAGMPGTVHEYRDLVLLGRRLSGCQASFDLYNVFGDFLAARFEPQWCWLARSRGVERELTCHNQSPWGPAKRLPEKHVRESLSRRASILYTRSGEHGERVSGMVAPLLLGRHDLGAVVVECEAGEGTYTDGDLHFFLAACHVLAPYVQALEETEQLRRDHAQLVRQSAASTTLVGSSPGMEDVRSLARQAAASTLSVLILGETGTGKELVARMIHDHSPRAGRPYVLMNCASIPQELFESELFGYERGAFTGAVRRKVGLLEEAHGGTFFLDEVGDLSPSNQARILRVLEDKCFRRVGGTEDIEVDVRFIAATNQPIEEHVDRGAFRSDLYYRLEGMVIHLPPLRERREDIRELAEHFLALHGERGRRCILADDAIRRLEQWDWRGNVRELKACIERAVHTAPELVITADDIALRPIGSTPPAPDFGDDVVTLAEAEKWHIKRALEKNGGNVRATARALGISHVTLYKKVREYNLRKQPPGR